MKCYRAYFNGLEYYADISKGTLNDDNEYSLFVYARDWRGLRQPDYHHVYKSERGAQNALKRRYPGVEWNEI